jgi:hypothetical protein
MRARFWPKVNQNGPVPAHEPELGPCWLWTASTSANGYGAFGITHGARRMEGAHRVAWFLEHGDWPSQFVLHKCDNKICVRPSHLFLGTQADNIRDMDAKARGRRVGSAGMANGNVRLTDSQVREIYQRKCAGELQRALAIEYGVDQTHISRIGRINWRHLVNPAEERDARLSV